ncbi:MAG: hypothetical protein J0H73_10105, partial [Salana multivorans]|nr:hypothetical protein [Salana multivorans]
MVELADPVDLAIPGRAGDPEAPDRDPAAAARSSVAPGAPVSPGAPDDPAAGATDDQAAAVAGGP